jgi:NADH-quinone oxidoreductase subunit J
MQFIHNLLLIFLLFTAISIFTTSNSVYSVLFLVLCFIFSAIILILFQTDFLALLFVMIYVGAVAVLFLFVIMMIDTKSVRQKVSFLSSKEYFFIFYISMLFIIKLYFVFKGQFFDRDEELNFYPGLYTDISEKLTNVELIGQVLYNNYGVFVLVAGFVLLIALIGSICLTLDFKKEKTNNSNKQATRDSGPLNLYK